MQRKYHLRNGGHFVKGGGELVYYWSIHNMCYNINSIDDALKLLQSCAEPSIYLYIYIYIYFHLAEPLSRCISGCYCVRYDTPYLVPEIRSSRERWDWLMRIMRLLSQEIPFAWGKFNSWNKKKYVDIAKIHIWLANTIRTFSPKFTSTCNFGYLCFLRMIYCRPSACSSQYFTLNADVTKAILGL